MCFLEVCSYWILVLFQSEDSTTLLGREILFKAKFEQDPYFKYSD